MILFLFYFIPYTLMAGEMGATVENGAGGVSSWIKETMSSKLAFFAGWTFWVVNIPYLAQKPQNILFAMGWALFLNDQLTTMISPMMLQLISLGIFMFFMWYAAQGVSALKRIGSIAGSFMFIMSILYVLLVLAAPYITEAKTFSYSLSWDTFMPNFNFEYMTTLSILVFAVGGRERIAPYDTNLQNPDKAIPRAMIVMPAKVAVPAVLCKNHGPFTWGKNAHEAVHNAVVLEEVAKMASRCELINPNVKPAPQELQDKHYYRKHGANAYYGQENIE